MKIIDFIDYAFCSLGLHLIYRFFSIDEVIIFIGAFIILYVIDRMFDKYEI